MLLWFFCLISSFPVQAFIPEGLESMSLYKGSAGKSHIYASYQSMESVWRSEGGGLITIVDYFTGDKNLFTAGYFQTVDNSDKNAYFFRYDLTAWDTQSISLKYLHNGWNYIPAAQENLALEFNGFYYWGSGKTGTFYSLGFNYSWLKQSWNTDYQNPLSTNSIDQSFYVVACLGIQWEFGSSGNFFGVDLNNRDPFNYENTDNFATDLAFYFTSKSGMAVKFFAGSRWSTFWTYIPGFPASNYFGAGIVY